MKYKYLLLLIVVACEVFALVHLLSCRQLNGAFHFSASDLTLQLDDAIHNDGGISPSIVRIFHNKATGTFVYVLKNYLQYFDEIFLIQILSVIGVVGLLFSIHYCIWKGEKRKIVLPLFIAMLIFPLVEIFTPHIFFPAKLVVLVLPYQLLSLIGYWQFIKHQKFTIVLLVTFTLLLVSIGYFAEFSSVIYQLCDRL